MRKAMWIILFSVVTMGFIFGLITYQKSLSAMMEQEIKEELSFEKEEKDIETPVETPRDELEGKDIENEEKDDEQAEKKVPTLYGLNQEEAEKLLKQEGFSYQVYLEEKKNTKVGEIFYQRPRPGELISSEETIHFSISKDMEDSTIEKAPVSKEVKVPDLKGLSENNAKTKVQSVGFIMKTTKIYSSKSKGTVISQSIASGTLAEKGSTITVTISLGLKEDTPEAPSPGPEPESPNPPVESPENEDNPVDVP